MKRLGVGVIIAFIALAVNAPRLILVYLRVDNLALWQGLEASLLVLTAIATGGVLSGGGAYIAHTLATTKGGGNWRILLIGIWLLMLFFSVVLLSPLMVSGLRISPFASVLTSDLAQWTWAIVAVLAVEVMAAGAMVAEALTEEDKRNHHICDNTGETPIQEPRTLLEALGVPSVPHSLNATIEQPQVDMVTDGVVYSDPLPPAVPTPKPLPLPLPKPKPSKAARSNVSGISNRERVLAYLNKHGDKSPKTIVEALGVPYGTASGYLNEWRKSRANVPSMATGD